MLSLTRLWIIGVMDVLGLQERVATALEDTHFGSKGTAVNDYHVFVFKNHRERFGTLKEIQRFV